MEMYFYKYKRHLQLIMDWEICNEKIFILILQYFPPSLEEVLKTMTGWTAINKAQDGNELLKLV